MIETNGRIKLSWQQAVTIVGFFLAMGAAWYDMRGQIASVHNEMVGMRAELALRVRQADIDHAGFDRRIDRLEGRRGQ